jgi:hypothetical protein
MFEIINFYCYNKLLLISTPKFVFRKQMHKKQFFCYVTPSHGVVCCFIWNGRKPPTHRCENIQSFIVRAILEYLIFLCGSNRESHLISTAAQYETRSDNGHSRLRYTRLSSVSPFSKMLILCFQNKITGTAIPLQAWRFPEYSRR